ncbi:MAG: DNA gyrase inhibitor YacG [Burkholderiaceae bacterium]
MKSENTTQLREKGPHVACPSCGDLTRFSPANPFRPFCSERCKVIDLGAWASEQYRIAGNPKDVSSDDPESDLT